MLSTTELSQFNHYKNLSQWQQLVCDCRNSGMTVKAWCAEKGISEKAYLDFDSKKKQKPPFFPYSCKGLRGVLLFVIV